MAVNQCQQNIVSKILLNLKLKIMQNDKNKNENDTLVVFAFEENYLSALWMLLQLFRAPTKNTVQLMEWINSRTNKRQTTTKWKFMLID